MHNLSAAISATMQSAVQAASAMDTDGGGADIRVWTAGRSVPDWAPWYCKRPAWRPTAPTPTRSRPSSRDASERTQVFATLDTLENLRKGGRIGSAQALLGSMLSIKPIVDFSSGAVEEAAKQRTRRKALGWLRDAVRAAEPVEHLAVMHGEAPDVDDFCEMLTEVHRGDIRVCKVGPVVGTHAGQGVLGMAYQVPAT